MTFVIVVSACFVLSALICPADMIQFLLALLTFVLGVSPVVGQHVTSAEILSQLEENIAHIQNPPGSQIETASDIPTPRPDNSGPVPHPTSSLERITAYNTASGKVIGQVSSQGIVNGEALVDCAQVPESCEENSVLPSPRPRPSASPIPPVTPLPTEVPLPSVWPCEDGSHPCPLPVDPPVGIVIPPINKPVDPIAPPPLPINSP